MADGIKPADLQAGKRYKVTFDDCCVRGWFEAAFVELRYDTKEPDFLDEIVFDTGGIAPDWGNWTVTEVSGE